MKKYNNKCGLTKQEFELERLVDAVRSEPSTLICIKILERGFKKLNTPRVSVAKHPLPRPLECWNKARELECGDYIEWHLNKERGNAR